MRTIDLDNNATTRPAESVIQSMQEALFNWWHNPSSVHRPGQAVRAQVELARESVASLIGCQNREVVFTGSGTESCNLAIQGSLAQRSGRNVLVTSRIEHSAVREQIEALAERGTEVIWLAVDAHGVVDLDALDAALDERSDDIALVSIMAANNETGVLQPIEHIGAKCREHGVWFHTDAVQRIGKLPTNVHELPVDLLSCSAHKLHGPKGIGALFIRRGIRLVPQIMGGPQERERRGGTENVPGIVGFGVAARLAQAWLETSERDSIERLRDHFEQSVLATIDGAVVNGAGANRLWNTTNIAFPRLEAEAILLLLSERGVCASAGAACSSGSLDPSPVILAMGVEPHIAHGSVRLSLSRETTAEDIERALEVVPNVIERLQRSHV